MKTNQKRKTRTFFCYVLVISLLIIQGCSTNQPGPGNDTVSESMQPSESDPPTETTESSEESETSEESESTEPSYEPFQYETGNHYCSQMLKDNVGDEVLKAAYDVIDAFIAHKTSVKVEFTGHYQKFTEDLGFALNCIFPPFSACAEYNSLHTYNKKNGTVSWKYKFEKSECDEIINACEEATEKYMSTLREGDTDTTKALLLYHALTKDAFYDYDVLTNVSGDSEEFERRTSAYQSLVNKSGICYSFSFALVYLYMRAGINCITPSSMEGVGAHMWVMVELADKYYYVDPTWDLGGGFYHFGMTSGDRASWAGSYAEDTCFIHAVPVSGTYVIDDERFMDMRGYLTEGGIYDIEIDREKQIAVISNEYTTYSLDCR